MLMLTQPTLANSEMDPWEGVNRSIFWVNDGVDRTLLKPMAKNRKK